LKGLGEVEKYWKGRGKELVLLGIPPIFGKDPGGISLTYLSILKEGFMPIFSATRELWKKRFTKRKLA